MSFHLLTKWLWNRIPLQSLKLQISRLFWARNSLTFRQLESVYLIYSAYHNTQSKSLKLINFQTRLSLIINLKKVRFLRSEILSITSMPYFFLLRKKNMQIFNDMFTPLGLLACNNLQRNTNENLLECKCKISEFKKIYSKHTFFLSAALTAKLLQH